MTSETIVRCCVCKNPLTIPAGLQWSYVACADIEGCRARKRQLDPEHSQHHTVTTAMNHPDSLGRFELLSSLYAGSTLQAPPKPEANEAERSRWQEWLATSTPLRLALNRAINLENEVTALRAKAAAWDQLAGIADQSAVSDVELSSDMAGPNKWIAIAGLLEGSFIEGLQASTPEQAVANLAETFAEWKRDSEQSCLEDG